MDRHNCTITLQDAVELRVLNQE